MFKKLKDKLAEEVKSSPQRIQQFAQAAQAAVTSASSSISDITNTDLFSIGDNDSQQSRSVKSESSANSQHNTFQDVSLGQPAMFQSDSIPVDYTSAHETVHENQRQRRLSNSSFASDISFRLPSYESPSMYHLQSDMEISASEAEERGFSGNTVSLERVTKEQIYAAYKRTQERYTKYRTQYADLARHYKLLERENAKAKSVLVETQDKALRRISELREQCALEQSAKAHLEKALRVEIEERNLKIDTLNTKVKLLQDTNENNENSAIENDSNTRKEDLLINISPENDKQINESSTSEIFALNHKIEKLDQLVLKYKESLKQTKDKNSQLATEIQLLSSELESKAKENEHMKITAKLLTEAEQRIKELNEINEELQNKINSYDFNKTREASTLELDLQKAQEELELLQSKIEVYIKREEEYAISLAENKLSIHKELEGKENEIKSLKDGLSTSKKEIQSLQIIISDYKNTISALEEERSKLNKDVNELNLMKSKISELESQIQIQAQKYQTLEATKAKADEEFKCFQLQLKQETAEKLAMIDRNTYLENRNTQLSDENAKKTSKITTLDNELQMLIKSKEVESNSEKTERNVLLEEMHLWKDKYNKLECEIQEERDELVKLQSEIEKLLANYELIQIQNTDLNNKVKDLTAENSTLQMKVIDNTSNMKSHCGKFLLNVKDLQQNLVSISEECRLLRQTYDNDISLLNKTVHNTVAKFNDFDIKLRELQKEHSTSLEESKKIREMFAVTSNDLESVKRKNEELLLLIESKNIENEQITSKYAIEQKKLENENRELKSSIQTDDVKSSTEINTLQKELQELKNMIDCKEFENQQISTKHLSDLNLMQKENDELKSALEEKEKETSMINDKSQNEIVSLRQENSKLKNVVQSNERESKELTASHSSELNFLKNENQELKSIIESREYEISHINSQSESEINELQNQMDSLNATIKCKDVEYSQLKDQISEVKANYDNKLKELDSINKDKQILTEKLASAENMCQSLRDTMQNESNCKVRDGHKISSLEQENQNEAKKISTMENEMEELLKKIKKLSEEQEQNLDVISELTRDKAAILDEKKNMEIDKRALIDKLKSTIKNLTEENDSLKFQSEKICSSVNDLEKELSEIKRSHAEIETEKDRLNSIIEKLENNERENSLLIPTGEDIIDLAPNNTTQEHGDLSKMLVVSREPEIIKVANVQQLNKIILEKADDREDKELINEMSLLKNENSLHKEENRRLQSDIAGLQSYLTKISKENSVLNDKLREFIASSENSPDKTEIMALALTDLNNEMQLGKQKIDDLIRENTLLVDENLELKDQINSHNYEPINNKQVQYENKTQNMNQNEKYTALLETKNRLDKKLNELEHSNSSLNSNMMQVQQNNEKLRLSNEKLERRLDEALVSLRHLHSLQENTELEYLRNILFEYFTGSGTHSITLAKVLSAVVKFDDRQTQQVLQKEKERQGLLRQLGLL